METGGGHFDVDNYHYNDTVNYTNVDVDADETQAWAISRANEEESNSESEDEEDWDVYRDFNNMGQTRYEANFSEPPAQQRDQQTLPSRRARAAQERPYMPWTGPQLVSFHGSNGLYPSAMSSEHVNAMQSGNLGHARNDSYASEDAKPFAYDLNESSLELAPLGQEYTPEERKRMTRKGQRKYWKYSQLGAVDSWMRGHKPICGFFGPHVAVFALFGFVILLGITLYFVVPRVPSVALKTYKPLTAANGESAMNITAQPTGFFMNGTLGLRLDNSGGWIPSEIKKLDAVVNYKNNNIKVGEGSVKYKSIPGKKQTDLNIPIYFNYHSLNSTGDDIQLAFQDACAHPYLGVQRTSLDLSIDIILDIQAVPGTHKTSLGLTSYACPWVLPN
ncbi:hypothetical protein MYAM1_000248 [Malassezia yamatoensis]|uniref:Late embryogenesis abundant protein LEA-2 subgroup domain-containing protein n=1 Tax=Malassezia yamatoensis TaxID=253288 RepID=A0AAJ5YNG4_9BASI|nr:hypothetical protein MYAM1_000248 [Malassezia yamatoensis]